MILAFLTVSWSPVECSSSEPPRAPIAQSMSRLLPRVLDQFEGFTRPEQLSGRETAVLRLSGGRATATEDRKAI
jgi:hypothetical protein